MREHAPSAFRKRNAIIPAYLRAEMPLGVRHLAARSDIGEARKAVGWNHVRLSVVVPIGVIVAVAIVCVVVAVLGSAQRADQVALETERQLFTRALANHSERVLREIESVATSERATRRIQIGRA